MSNISNIQNQFGEHLFNFISSKVSSPDDAQDIYQEVIIKILKKSDQLVKTQSLKSWLFTVAKNQIVDFYRAKKSSSALEIPIENAVSVEESTDVYQELEGCLSGFINALPEDYKHLILLSEIEGKSQKELSTSLGLNYVTVRSKIQRGREKIKNMIFEACDVQKDSRGRFQDCEPKGELSCTPGGATCGSS